MEKEEQYLKKIISKLHPTQKKLFDLIKKQSLQGIGYKKIGRLIDVDHPQKVKYHLTQLMDKGIIDTDLLSLRIDKIPKFCAGCGGMLQHDKSLVKMVFDRYTGKKTSKYREVLKCPNDITGYDWESDHHLGKPVHDFWYKDGIYWEFK